MGSAIAFIIVKHLLMHLPQKRGKPLIIVVFFKEMLKKRYY